MYTEDFCLGKCIGWKGKRSTQKTPKYRVQSKTVPPSLDRPGASRLVHKRPDGKYFSLVAIQPLSQLLIAAVLVRKQRDSM